MSDYNMVRTIPAIGGLILRRRDVDAIMTALTTFGFMKSHVAVNVRPGIYSAYMTYLLLPKKGEPMELTIRTRAAEIMTPAERAKRIRAVFANLHRYTPWDLSDLMERVDALLKPAGSRVEDGRLVRA